MKRKYFTMSLHTFPEIEVKNLLEYKRLDGKGIEYLHQNEWKYIRLNMLKRKVTSGQLKIILRINPELLEYFV